MVNSYSIFLLIIIILGVFLYASTIKNIKNRFQEQNYALLNNSIQLLDKDFQVMDVFSRQLLQNSDFWSVNSSTSITSTSFRTEGLSLKNYLATNIYPDTLLPLQDFYIYFENTNYVISPNVFSARNMFYSGIKKYKKEGYDIWVEQLLNPEYYGKMLSMDEYYSIPGNHFYLYIIDMDSLNYRNANATISFIMDEAQIAGLFSEIEFYNDGYLIVCNEDNEIMFSLSEQDPDSGSTPLVNSISTLSSLHFTDSFAHFSQDGMSMLVTKSVSPENGWTYYLVQPESAAYKGVSGLRYAYLVCLLLALVGGIYLIFFLSRRNMAPIVELGAELQVVTEEKSQLQEVVNKQKPIITNSYIQQLFGGSISSEDEMLYIKDYLGLHGETLAYNVIYVVAYNNSGNAGESSPGNIAYLNAEDFEDVMGTTLRDYFGEPFYCYSPANRTYALLLTCASSDAASLVMKAQETVVRLHEYLLDNHDIWMFAGIGQTTDSLMNVWECYQQAVEAVGYTTKNYIFFPYEITKKDSNAFYYPPELSTKLIHFITSGNKPQVLELFSLIHKENIEERSLPINLLQFLMQDIRNTLLKARFSLPSGTDKEIVSALDERFNEHLSFKLCEDLALSLCELFQNGAKDTNLAATIEKYISQNYKDPSLCLNKISDEFQISESYFSHMFKEKTGVNFSVYLENIRMNEAAKLIRETDTNLSELYIQVGYNNPATFRRAFKKTYGVTPSSMRESAGNH
ncbi:MAG: helix-turn-helix domain-containing protein [Lachnospiraceae bacterium]